jgi:hypothetical protein
MDSADHVQIIQDHLPETVLDGVICNNFQGCELPENVSWCKISAKADDGPEVFEDDLIDKNYPWRHDPDKLTNLLIRTWEAIKKPSL